jgi:hypothetical protein
MQTLCLNQTYVIYIQWNNFFAHCDDYMSCYHHFVSIIIIENFLEAHKTGKRDMYVKCGENHIKNCLSNIQCCSIIYQQNPRWQHSRFYADIMPQSNICHIYTVESFLCSLWWLYELLSSLCVYYYYCTLTSSLGLLS